MIAWIEMNRLLGVNHFMIYDFDLNPELRKLMAHYHSLGIVSILEWKLSPIPVSTQQVWPPPKTKVHYFGQFAAYNDCLYRLGNRFRYLMFTDLDEMIVPLKNARLNDYLKSVDAVSIAQFRFRNTYVRTDYPQNNWIQQIDPAIAAHNVPFLRFTRREKRVLPTDVGQKVVVKFYNSHVMGVHELIVNSKDTFDVPPEEGLLFHYRTPPNYLNFSDEGQNSSRLTELMPLLVRNIQEVLKVL